MLINRRIGRALACTGVLLALSGCGPIGYLRKVSRDATQAVAEAEAAGAPQHAPYEYWGAVTYLHQSKQMMAHSEYERSFDYGERAQQLAEEAERKAQLRESGALVERFETEPKAQP